jgi:hypothetical protein
LCAFYKNIHSSRHTDSCVNKFLPYCRYCKGSVLAPVSGGRLIIPKDNGKDQIPRYTFDVAPVPEPDPYREDLFGSPVQPIDCRPISFEIKRRQVALLDPADLANISGDFDLADCLNSDILKGLDPELKNAILNLSSAQRASLRDEIINHNQWCTEFVPAPMACLACNTAGNPPVPSIHARLIDNDFIFSVPHGSGNLRQVNICVLLPLSSQGASYFHAICDVLPIFN